MHSFSPPTFTNRVVYTLASLPQAHNYWGGLISYFNADRGGQAYAYKPELP